MLLKKRSFKLELPQGELNIVSLMDVLTTLLFFLLVVASFTKLSVLGGAGVPSNAVSDPADTTPRFMLEVTLKSDQSAEVWLAPTAELKMRPVTDLDSELRSAGFSGSPSRGYTQTVGGQEIHQLLARVQETLIPIKRAYPIETSSILTVADAIPYQKVVDAITALRELPEGKTTFKVQDAAGNWTQSRVLFPQTTVTELPVESAARST